MSKLEKLNMESTNYAVILAGGKGERFWPMSTRRRPKQLLSIVGESPLISAATDRIRNLIAPDRILIITGADLAATIRKLIPAIPKENVIGEPFGRDTAAAIALGAVLIRKRNPGASFCVLTADHVIKRNDIFRRTLKAAFKVAGSADVLVTIGMKPVFPSTGFGYIETGEKYQQKGAIHFYKVKRFYEKPKEAVAARYIKAGNYYWNAGMFVWSLDAFQKALARHRPALLRMMDRLTPVMGKRVFRRVLKREYEKLETISVDYAVLEKARNIVMAKGEFEWDDVGSWLALENHFPRDVDGNITLGKVESVDSKNNIVMAKKGIVALLGVENLIVVQMGQATLICPKSRAQDVKKIVEHLKKKQHDYVL